MAIIKVQIHPAIGVARLGNSPDEFFIGLEKPLEYPDPAGGFKDAQCRVKRQAARFHIFAYNDDDTVEEITVDDAEITWTVHLANKKAITRNSGSAADLTIDPGPRTLVGPSQMASFDNGQIDLPGASAVTVPLGEVRTDSEGRLLVLGAFGTSASPTGAPINSFLDNDGWYDDISDGPVTATVKMNVSGDEITAEGAWVLVAPPKFAPQIDNVITLYDRIFQLGVEQGWLSGPATPSYTNDIWPILQRARDTQWVRDVFGAHAWPDPVYDQATAVMIFNKLKDPGGGGGNMPQLSRAALTPTQYGVMFKWAGDPDAMPPIPQNFTQDWVEPPAPPANITPEGLDHAALDACVGAAFYPGIEAGGIAQVPILVPGNYVGASDPMRIDHASVGAGDMSEFMALPWQADFKACGTNWWPVPRPNDVIPQGGSGYLGWARGVGSMLEMVSKWHSLGFVVKQGDEYVEVDRCDMTFITLMTHHLNFQDVPQGPMGMSRKTALAVVFEVRSTGSAVDLQVTTPPAHARLTLDEVSISVGPTVGNEIATGRFWVIYETGMVGELVNDQLTITGPDSQTWTVTITATTVPRLTSAVAMVLDRSGSMNDDRGDGQSKYQSLQDAAAIFVDVMVEGDAIGLVRYNQDAQPIAALTSLGPAGDPFDPARQAIKSVITGSQLTPNGWTSIGDGIFEGRLLLDATPTAFDLKSLVVLTDGKENRSRFIADVATDINESTYAVGLGTPQNTSAPALQTLSGNNGGYLLVTGAISGDNQFILKKYFLQILADISNADIVLDPDGELIPGQEHRVPFLLTEADAGIDVILLTEFPQAVDFRLETPTGQIIAPWRAMAEPAMLFRLSNGVTYFRLALPAELTEARFDQAGTWHALLSIGKPRLERPDDRDDVPIRRLRRDRTHLPFELRESLAVNPDLAAANAAASFEARAAAKFISTTNFRVPPKRRHTLPYSLIVHSYSNLSFKAQVDQSSYEPGATARLRATLAESGVPARPGASVYVEITPPAGTPRNEALTEVAAGEFETAVVMSAPGVYRLRVRASGSSRAGYPFQREHALTGAVWRGGDRDADPETASGGPLVEWLDERDKKFCELLDCVFGGVITPEVEKRLRAGGIDIDRLEKCLARYCRPQERSVSGEGDDA
ncbi:MAG: LodA/GoxA family CTQ-dependent oxidase [Alphaproteobacteria bacterium]